LCAPEDALEGLLHDGSEAVLGDLASPLKHSPLLVGLRTVEAAVERAIAERFGTRVGKPASVAHADLVAAAMELRDLVLSGEYSSSLPTALPPEPLVPWSWQVARDRFLERFAVLETLRSAR
jgi:5'-deoxynucleotidase YfbR-like HD superfamily hydrolase